MDEENQEKFIGRLQKQNDPVEEWTDIEKLKRTASEGSSDRGQSKEIDELGIE